MLERKAAEKGVLLGAFVGIDKAPLHVRGDLVRVRQILINLVGNAIKFTEQGEVSVSLAGQIEGESLRLRYAVQDSGIGIGLSICRDLVALMGGEVGVESKSGEGSTFWFEILLPITLVEDKQPVTAATLTLLREEEWLGKARVLIADNNAVNRKVLDLPAAR